MKKKPVELPEEGMRLNKYVAHAGIASRRAAADLIKQGNVSVDGQVVTDIGYRVMQGSKVTFKGKAIEPKRDFTYILMNKPRDVITTVKDEKGRRTVIDLVRNRVQDRIYPVGRLDRNTTGLLLLTNDGDLAKKLSHPSHEIKKIYHVVLNRKLKDEDLENIRKGIQLEDGLSKFDKVDFLTDGPKTEVGVELHSGRNRIIRRTFEAAGFEVQRLDRVYYAGLTKKNLPRGRFRPLTYREVIMLKHFS